MTRLVWNQPLDQGEQRVDADQRYQSEDKLEYKGPIVGLVVLKRLQLFIVGAIFNIAKIIIQIKKKKQIIDPLFSIYGLT